MLLFQKNSILFHKFSFNDSLLLANLSVNSLNVLMVFIMHEKKHALLQLKKFNCEKLYQTFGGGGGGGGEGCGLWN